MQKSNVIQKRSKNRAITNGLVLVFAVTVMLIGVIKSGFNPFIAVGFIVVLLGVVTSKAFNLLGHRMYCGVCQAEFVEEYAGFERKKQVFKYCPSCGAELLF